MRQKFHGTFISLDYLFGEFCANVKLPKDKQTEVKSQISTYHMCLFIFCLVIIRSIYIRISYYCQVREYFCNVSCIYLYKNYNY